MDSFSNSAGTAQFENLSVGWYSPRPKSFWFRHRECGRMPHLRRSGILPLRYEEISPEGLTPLATGSEGRLDVFNLLLKFSFNMSSASCTKIETTAKVPARSGFLRQAAADTARATRHLEENEAVWVEFHLALGDARHVSRDPRHLVWQVNKIPSLASVTIEFDKTPAGSPGR